MPLSRFKKNYPRVYAGLQTAGKVAKVAYQAYGIATTIAGLINAEKKFKDISTNNTSITTTPLVLIPSSVAQGTTEITRIGNSTLAKSVQLKALIERNTAGATNQYGRIVAVLDHNNNDGTPPAMTDVLDALTPTSNYKIDNMGRFQVLYDKTFTLTSVAPNKTIKWFHQFQLMKDKKGNKVRGHHMTYKGATANDYDQGHVFIYFWSNSATNAPNMAYMNTRYRFMDN